MDSRSDSDAGSTGTMLALRREKRGCARAATFRAAVVAAIAATLASTMLVDEVLAAECRMLQIGELPVRLAHNKLIVDGELNGQKIGVALDTGTTRTFLLRSSAERLGLRHDQVRGLRMFGIGGETNVESALVNEFKIGQASRTGWRMLVEGEHPLSDIDVFLGDDFFNSIDIEFDLAHRSVRLFQTKDCEGVSLAYWARDGASQVEIEPVDPVRPQIVLTVRIDGQPLRALLDSGATISLLDKPAASGLGITPETSGVVRVGRSMGLGTKVVEYWVGPFKSFAIGDETIKDPLIVFGDVFKNASYVAPGSYVRRRIAGTAAMLLGADFLISHRVLVAHSQRKMYFTYSGGTLFQRVVQASSAGAGFEAGDRSAVPER
ncbi:MAG TPA: retroviral-like aspartic protease family protein [Casimicrobiaceae bacterium]|nr:retroviral-like aspartic protease family protein [Casimicrobiaceae bacterium]